jgi:hypothetical protein
MRRIHLSLFVFCSATAAYADTPFMGQCHMDACGWIRIREKNLLKQKGDARLFEVKSDYGESFHKNGNYPNSFSEKLKVTWSDNGKNYFLCYNRLPVLFDGKEAYVLDFTNISGAAEAAANEYLKVCYNADPYAWDKEAFLEKHGLKPPSVTEVKIREPTDLLKYVK